MEFSQTTYSPLPLAKSHSYPAFQFYATITCKKKDELFTHVIDLIENWLAKRRETEAKETAENRFPKEYSIEEDAYQVRTVYLPSSKEWTMKLREPDSPRDKSKAIVGRFFVTQVSIKEISAKAIEFGCKIDVIDPVGIPEVNNAFRPLFIRELFKESEEGLINVLHDEIQLPYNHPSEVSNEVQCNKLKRLLSDKNNQLPIVLFIPPEKSEKMISFEASKEAEKGRIFQESLNEINDCACFIAEHSFGYSHTFLVEFDVGKLVRSFVKVPNDEGCVFIFEPTCFGGKSKCYSFSDIKKDGFRDDFKGKIRSCGKHKGWSFGSLRFYRELIIEKEKNQFADILKKYDASKEDLAAVERANDALLKEIEELKKENESLKADCQAEYDRGQAETIDWLDGETRKQEERIKELEADNRSLQARVESFSAKEAKEKAIQLSPAKGEELYTDEQYDLIISILQNALSTYCEEGTRAEELLKGILDGNPMTQTGLDWLEKIEKILNSNQGLSQSDIRELRRLGFDIPDEKAGSGHIKASIQKYTFMLPATPSDWRSMKNVFAQIRKVLSVYK